MERDPRQAALDRLQGFVGEWSMEASFGPAPATGIDARTFVEWTLDGQFLLQRSEVPHPAAPDGLSIIGTDPDSGEFTQHYFDSRGVVRIYAMTFDGRAWTLLRDSPDFSPLDFSQRFTADFTGDGNTIEGKWETSSGGSRWEHDFDLVYRRIRPVVERFRAACEGSPK